MSRSGKPTLSDGGHRFVAAKARGDETINAIMPKRLYDELNAPKVPDNQWIDAEPGVRTYSLNRPGQANASARLETLGDGSARINVEDFSKPEGAPKGSGRAALRELAETGKEHGAKVISGVFGSHAALGALGSEFGKHNIQFFDRKTGDLLDIDFAEAMKKPDAYIAEVDSLSRKSCRQSFHLLMTFHCLLLTKVVCLSLSQPIRFLEAKSESKSFANAQKLAGFAPSRRCQA